MEPEITMAKAAIDIGSNSILLTVISDEGIVVEDVVRVVGLGQGLGDRGLFKPERMKDAEMVFTEFLEIAKNHGVQSYSIKAIATSAARRAMNARTWFTRLQRKLGLRIQIISGEEEARLTWLGASQHLAIPTGPRLVIDLGGGSTELVLGNEKGIIFRTSLEIGSVRLTESFMTEECYTSTEFSRMKNHIDTALSDIHLDPTPAHVIGVAGTVTTLAAMKLRLTQFTGSKVHGAPLTREDLAGFEQLFLGTHPKDRQALVPLSPERADYLLAGVAILDRILRTSRSLELVTSIGGIRYGVLG